MGYELDESGYYYWEPESGEWKSVDELAGQAEAPAAADGSRDCPSCGFKMKPEWQMCPSCGQTVQ